MRPAQKTQRFPSAPLYGAFAMIAFTLAVVIATRLSGVDISYRPKAEPAQMRELRFADEANGAVAVLDAKTGAAVDTVAPGANGFLRTTMRAMARQRKIRGIGSEPPFRLVAWTDGAMTLEDPSTGKRVNLRAFGDENAKSIAYLMSANGAAR